MEDATLLDLTLFCSRCFALAGGRREAVSRFMEASTSYKMPRL